MAFFEVQVVAMLRLDASGRARTYVYREPGVHPFELTCSGPRYLIQAAEDTPIDPVSTRIPLNAQQAAFWKRYATLSLELTELGKSAPDHLPAHLPPTVQQLEAAHRQEEAYWAQMQASVVHYSPDLGVPGNAE